MRITDIYGYKVALKMSSALSAGVFFDELSKFSEVGVIKYLWECKKCGRHAPWVPLYPLFYQLCNKITNLKIDV